VHEAPPHASPEFRLGGKSPDAASVPSPRRNPWPIDPRDAMRVRFAINDWFRQGRTRAKPWPKLTAVWQLKMRPGSIRSDPPVMPSRPWNTPQGARHTRASTLDVCGC